MVIWKMVLSGALLVALVALQPGPAQGRAMGSVAERPSAEASAAESSAAPATGKNCLGEPGPRVLMRQVLGIKWGPWGVEHQLRVGGCAPLVRKPGILFDYSFVEAGFQSHTSPIYFMPGVYLDLAPLSFLQFHLQFAPVFYWPIAFNGAGYFDLSGYEEDYSEQQLPHQEGERALGWYLRSGVTLQAAVGLGRIRLLVSNTLLFELWQLGEEDYYFHNRNDIPAAFREGFIDNLALLLAELPVHPNLDLRVGLNHQLTMNFGARQMSNFFGGVAMFRLKRLGASVRDFTPLFRLGYRPQHPVREGDLTFLIGLIFSADLKPKSGPQNSAAEATPASDLPNGLLLR
ncbi:MAG: hypothetical protein CMP23_15020 [Rickettsiales bacterium]|nr:hypothetical protein [Rickettsiales bacterium]|tara:strand:+ start:1414 stop:2451 length:1038 start_codon:yes stop_codon:yes gene_type:complete